MASSGSLLMCFQRLHQTGSPMGRIYHRETKHPSPKSLPAGRSMPRVIQRRSNNVYKHTCRAKVQEEVETPAVQARTVLARGSDLAMEADVHFLTLHLKASKF